MRKKFNVGEPASQLENIQQVSKYKIGESGYSFYAIKNLKPVFAFDYVSLMGHDLCFNSHKLDIKDYVGFIEGLKKISNTTYNELHDVAAYRFHKINFDDPSVTITKKQFKAVLTHKDDLLKDEELPTLYQFDLQYLQKARVCGFLFKGVFYVIWYDRDHTIYSTKR